MDDPHLTLADPEPSECARTARRYERDDELMASPLPRALRALAACQGSTPLIRLPVRATGQDDQF